MKIVSLLTISVLLLGCFGKQPANTLHMGEPIPEFKLILADSTTYLNTNNLSFKTPVVFFYFGPRCPYSRAQMQEIIDNIHDLNNIQFVILTASSFSQMKWFYNNFKLKEYSNFIIGLDYKHFFSNYFKTNAVPYIAIYSKEKRLKEVFSGQTPVWQIKDVVEK